MRMTFTNPAAFVACMFAGLSMTSPAIAQHGLLDQYSPNANADFNVDASTLTWQQEVRAGMDGRLTGVALVCTGREGVSRMEIAIGFGSPSDPRLVHTTEFKLQNDGAWNFIDLSDANVYLNAGETFFIQTVGDETGMGIRGSKVDVPLYAQPLALNGEPFGDGEWRQAFRTYMNGGAGDCLTLTLDQLAAGESTRFTISDGTPGERGVLVYGSRAGVTMMDERGGYCATFGIAGVDDQRALGGFSRTFDADGELVIRQQIASGGQGQMLYFQAAEHATCPRECVSNLITRVVR